MMGSLGERAGWDSSGRPPRRPPVGEAPGARSHPLPAAGRAVRTLAASPEGLACELCLGVCLVLTAHLIFTRFPQTAKTTLSSRGN